MVDRLRQQDVSADFYAADVQTDQRPSTMMSDTHTNIYSVLVRLKVGLHRISALAAANPKSGHFSQIRPTPAPAKFLDGFGRRHAAAVHLVN